METTLISTSDLQPHLADKDWAIVDCRFDLAQPEWGFEEYQKSHIPGAVYAHMDKDLAGPITPFSGRHPLPDVNTFVHRLNAWGIGDNTQVIAYDTSGGSFAVRLWWLLRWLGHSAVAVLDGGFPKWKAEERPVAAGVETRPSSAEFHPIPDWSIIAYADEVDRIRQDPNYVLIDARAPERYRGEVEPIDPVAGHIPGAINHFYGKNLAPDGTFLPPEELRKQFLELIGNTSPDHVVVYCGSGVTSIHHLLALELAGLPGARLYAGSWSEWIRDPNRPVSK